MNIVYISAPLNASGIVGNNIRTVVNAADRLRANGFLPIVPHFSFFWDLISPHKEQYWLAIDKELIQQVCHILLRLPGKSKNADTEIEWANEAGLVIYKDIDQLIIDRVHGKI